MAIEAWYMDESNEDPRLPHHRNPKEIVSLDKLAEVGVLQWKLDAKNYENDEESKKIREARGYGYMDLLDLYPEKVENYEQKLKNFYTEHIHADEEIRYCLEGSGYFDVLDKEDNRIRIWMKEGDLIILLAGIYHHFTLDTSNYVKATNKKRFVTHIQEFNIFVAENHEDNEIDHVPSAAIEENEVPPPSL